ncbi:MAG: hypothetical protein SCH98_10245 [Deferrisomatales bacterium]|nr:hypothetical protein [Deferrisomatales bacterium]
MDRGSDRSSARRQTRARGAAAAGLLLASTLAFATPARAFHEGGAAPCEGCHTMHGTEQGFVVGGNPFLLQAVSPTSLCLHCHQGQIPQQHLVSTSDGVLGAGLPPQMMTPGGDFAWLKRTYTWVAGGLLRREEGDRHGHNIVAPEFGYQSDALHATAPRGTYPSQYLYCTSCHDPHGRYRVMPDGTTATTGLPIEGSGSLSENGLARNPVAGRSVVGAYRLLAGRGYQPVYVPGQVFVEDPFAAIAPAQYNRPESAAQTRVAYGSNVSEWCGNCHAPEGGTGFPHHQWNRTSHPLGGSTSDYYNVYVKTGDLSGSKESSFTSLVPFQMELGNSLQDRGAMAAAARSDDGNLVGPGAQDTVMCLTCHRAHASGWRAMLRWNPDADRIVYEGAYPGTDTGAPPEYHMGRTEAEARRAYYDRPASVFAANQNRLCEKCHAGE